MAAMAACVLMVNAAATSESRHPQALARNRAAKLIVTGGAGYVGSHTLLELLRAGYRKVTVIDNLENGHAEAVPAAFDLQVQSTDDAALLTQLFQSLAPTAVIDFAAYLDVGQSQNEPREYVRNNVFSGNEPKGRPMG